MNKNPPKKFTLQQKNQHASYMKIQKWKVRRFSSAQKDLERKKISIKKNKDKK